MTWRDLERADPDLAAAGASRLQGRGVAYLATVSPEGAPRLHPVTPIVGEGHLFVFMEPTSPKGADLRRGSRFALHSAVADMAGGGGEFVVRGVGRLIDDPVERAVAERLAPYDTADRYVLFELRVESAMRTDYVDGQPVRTRFPR
jgi:Pyridoxamine 5'-phosphate oxidase